MNQTPSSKPKTTPNNISGSLFEIAEAAEKLTNNPRSKIAVAVLFEKLKVLEKQWHEFGNQYDQTQKDNERLLQECETERLKSRFYRKRLKFAKDHQENFERLQKLYVNIKEAEPNDNRRLLNKKVQTCVDIDVDQLSGAKKTLLQIKELVRKRENFMEKNTRNMDFLQSKIDVLEMQNKQLTMKMLEKSGREGAIIGAYHKPEESSSEIEIHGDGEGEGGILGCDMENTENNDTTESFESSHDFLDETNRHSIQNYEESISELEVPLMALRSIKSSLQNSGKLRVCRSSYDTAAADGREQRKVKQHRRDARAVLTRVQSEIRKKQLIITEKLDSLSQIR